MRCNDGTADGQSQTGSVNLRGKKRIEDLVRLLRGQPDAGIADGDHKLLVFRSPRLDGKLARPIHIVHRINAATAPVPYYLLPSHPISHALGKICRHLRPNCYGASRYLAPPEDDHL